MVRLRCFMKSLPIAAGMILLSLIPLFVRAQEIGYIDLTDNVFRERSRPAQRNGGGCGSSPHAQQSQSEVTVTVVSLDKIRYRIGEEVTFEIKVLNSGKKTIIVPWTPHSGDLEPADAHSSYRYRVSTISLDFKDPQSREFSIFENLYGSPNVPDSLRELSPGQWFTVRGRKRLVLYDQNLAEKEFGNSELVETKVSGLYRQDRGEYYPKNGGSDGWWCIPLPCQKANQLDVTLEKLSY